MRHKTKILTVESNIFSMASSECNVVMLKNADDYVYLGVYVAS